MSPPASGIFSNGVAKDSIALALGSIVSGIFAYAFFAVTTRSLGPVSAAPVSVLWTFWAFAGAAVTFPVQHWIIQATESDGGEPSVRAAMPRLWYTTLAMALILTMASWAVGERLFTTRGVTFPVLIGAVTLGACWSGVVRGVLSAKRRFVATGLAILGENVVRLAAGLAVALADGAAVLFGVALITGPLIGLLWTRDLPFRQATATTDDAGKRMGLIGGIALGGLIGQVVLTAGPAVVALLGGPARTVTALFASLALFRLPLVILVGLLSQVTGRVAAIVSGHRHTDLVNVRRVVLAATITAALVGASVGATIGDELVQLLFGKGLRLSQSTLALLGLGSGLALGNLAEGAILTAHQASKVYVIGWLAALVIAGLVVTVPGDPLQRTVLAFSSGELTAFVVLLAGEYKAANRLEPDPSQAA